MNNSPSSDVRYVVCYGTEHIFWLRSNMKFTADKKLAQKFVSQQCASEALWRARNKYGQLDNTVRVTKAEAL